MPKSGNKEIKEYRPPVVAVLGHIDHGKSTLIDYIRKTNIAEKEAGGITQHVSAYEISHPTKEGERHITFLDTPGHEAFGCVRSRSANVADIAALIVSAEDGVKPQTVEVLKQIKECALPFLVVITKIDKPSANILRTKQSLAENEIYVEGFGGSTPVIELSGKTGEGVKEFLDMIDLMAQIDEKIADRTVLGSGVIIESRRDHKTGISAIGIIKNGTVKKGLTAACAGAIAPMRFLLDAEGNTVEKLSFSSPVQIVGWNNMPLIGSEFRTFANKKEALAFANQTEDKSTQNNNRVMAEGVDVLPLIIKADRAGSLEVVTAELQKISRERITPKITLSSVGNINENDIKSALATDGAVVVGFNTKTDREASLLAERSGINILNFNVIYELTDKVKELLSEREPKIEVEEDASSSKILKLFGQNKGKQVMGGRVLSGTLKIDSQIKIMRREMEIGRGKIKELQQSKVATNSVDEGNEFGAMIESKIEVAPGDTLKSFTLVTK